MGNLGHRGGGGQLLEHRGRGDCDGGARQRHGHDEPGVAGFGPKAPRKRSRNALIGHTGACGLGRMPSTQPHPRIRRSTDGSWAMIEIGTSWLASSPLTVVAGWWSPSTTITRFLRA